MSTASPFIGIDFGTTHSSVAWYDPATSKPEIINNSEGQDRTPSVVYYPQEGHVVVGEAADSMLSIPQERRRVISSVKRDLTTARKHQIPGGQRIKYSEVATEIFKKLKRDAEDGHFHGDIKRAVVTFPAHFSLYQREKIEEAARAAGFKEVELLDEPVAAAIAYKHSGLNVGKTVLVYDLGGGTFDVAVLTHDEERLFRLAMDPQGMSDVGGDDFDIELYDYLDKKAEDELGHPINPERNLLDPDFLRKCRKHKEDLSTLNKVMVMANISIRDGSMKEFMHTIERNDFEELIESRVRSTVDLTKKILQTADLKNHEVETVVLIGGSTRVPLVRRHLSETLPLEPVKWHKQDVAVALGAAIFGHHIWGEGIPEKEDSSPAAPKREEQLEEDTRQEEQFAGDAGQREQLEEDTRQEADIEKIMITVDRAGGGDFHNLGDAITRAPSGSTIKIGAGEYHLTNSVLIEKSIHLVGKSMKDTVVFGESDTYLIKLAGPHLFTLEGITFLHKGFNNEGEDAPNDRAADVVVITDGTVEIAECRFKGGVKGLSNFNTGLDGTMTGSGLVLGGNVEGYVRKCEMMENDDNDIRIIDHARPTLEKNVCFELKLEGSADPQLKENACWRQVVYEESSGGIARENKFNRVSITDEASPLLENNSCAHISYSGKARGKARENNFGDVAIRNEASPWLEKNNCSQILYLGKASGIAKDNSIVGSTGHGIKVAGEANPTLEDNVCKENTGNGIEYNEKAGGMARRNQCTGNGESGVAVKGEAKPILVENLCSNNSHDGIFCTDDSTGEALQNLCKNNGWSGIRLEGNANFALEKNQCRENKNDGIKYGKDTKGTVDENHCVGNLFSGISVQGNAQPTVRNNICQGNGENGIFYTDSASGIARSNSCHNNKKNGIFLRRSAHPSLEKNDCSRNTEYGILLEKKTRPELVDNQCTNNGLGNILRKKGFFN